jgi:hypothetical protein
VKKNHMPIRSSENIPWTVPKTCAIYEDEGLVDLNRPRGAIFDWALAHHQELFPCIAWIKRCR